MSFAAVLLAPFVLLFPTVGAVEVRERQHVPGVMLGEMPPGWPAEPRGAEPPLEGWVFGEVAERFRVEGQNQVRIEQHMSIRVVPLSRPITQPRPFVLDLPRRDMGAPFVERNIGRCVPIANISGVQPDMGSRLILFLRDRRMISAMLERACRARDFYSGFYIERTSDGQLCVDRDTLQSRSGANCKLTRIRQLIEPEE